MIPGGGAVAVVLPPPAAAAAGAAAAAPPAGVAARVAWSPLRARVAWAAALFVLGCAAAAFALFAITLPPADSHHILGSCAPTGDEAADLRAASEKLLLTASSQVLGATVALLAPARPVAVFGCLQGWLTSYHATDVLWMLVACHDRPHGALAFHFWVFFIMRYVALAVGLVVSVIA